MSEIHYSHFGSPALPIEVVNAVSSYLRLRVYFSKGMVNNSELRNPENYAIRAIDSSTSFGFGCISVTPRVDIDFPDYVDLEVTDCTHGKQYRLTVTQNVLQSFDGFYLVGGNTCEFSGVSEMPYVVAALPITKSTIRVLFSKVMSPISDLCDPARYVWTSGLRTIKVEPESNSTVILTTTEQKPAEIYELTVG
jgi:hypothetical protein